MSVYALKDFLRNTPTILLHEYFDEEKLLADFEWTKKKGGVVEEAEIDELAEAIEAIPNKDFSAVDYHFRNIHDLADDNGIQCLIELSSNPVHDLQLVEEFESNEVIGCHSQSMWMFLKHKVIFDSVFQNQYLDSLSNWKDCEVGEKKPCDFSEEGRKALGEAIGRYLKRTRGWGRHCQVDHYHRTEPDRHCFFAYPEDCAKPELAYDDDGKLNRVSRRPVFEIVFMYEVETGLLRVHYPRARNARSMQTIFAKQTLGLKTLPDQNTLVYDLKKLKSKYGFPVETYLNPIKLKMLMIDLPGRERIIIEADPADGQALALYDRMEATVKAYGLNLSDYDVFIKKAKMQAIFKSVDGKKEKPLTFTIGYPDSCSLDDQYHDNKIRYHIDEKWGFRRKLLSKKPKDSKAPKKDKAK